ncbi:DUF3102 domain-containing protein [Clostridium botulinum]|uniref:DUF3102 domain-containing protein n=1 Tax=Clostridium botulinum TaxID=1491 RepID=UPI000957AF6D|nr:DUF3102 domain-containing protein [Clostridium botulinum]APU60760.1 hypothetical protein NPD8_2719 [Clostridium botulinum]
MRKKNIDVTQEEILESTVREILKLKKQTVKNILSIGDNLIFIKMSLPHGEFGEYVEEKVGFSQRTAQKFMKIAESFHDANAPSCLGVEKLYLLTTIPEKEREEFIVQNNIEEMSTRELKKKIKETKNPVKEKEQKTQSKIIDVEILEAVQKSKTVIEFKNDLNKIEEDLESEVENVELEELVQLEKDLEKHNQKIKEIKEKVIINKYKKHKQKSNNFKIVTTEIIENFGQTLTLNLGLKYNFYAERDNSKLLILENIDYYYIKDYKIEDRYNLINYNTKEMEKEIKQAIILKVIEMQKTVEERYEQVAAESQKVGYEKFYADFNEKHKDELNQIETPEQKRGKEILKKFYHTLAKIYHPDKYGGDGTEMQIVNQLKEMWGV